MAAQSFGSRLAAVLAGELVNKGCVIVAFMWLARTLDPAAYGEVEWALSLTMLFTLVADAGLTTWATAQIAAEPAKGPVLVGQVGWLRAFLVAPTSLVLIVVAVSYGGRAGSALAIYGLSLWLTPFLLQYLFNGLLRTAWAALGNAIRGFTFVIAVILLVPADSSPSRVAIAEILGAGALALSNVIVFRKVFGFAVPVRRGRDHLVSVLKQSWRIGATEVTWGAHWYAGLILLGYLATSTEVAWHSASLRLVMALHTGVWLYLYVLLPNLARVVTRDPPAWAEMVSESVRMTSWIGAGIALVGTLGAEPILTTVFGPPFVAATPTFRAAAWVIPTAWLSGHIRYSLIAAQQQQKDYHAALIGSFTTIGLTLLLVPFLRSTGAGLALLGGTIANAVAAWGLAIGVLPRCAYFRTVRTTLLCCVTCLTLGFIATPSVGALRATVLAATSFAGLAALAERERLGRLRTVFVDALRPRIGRADDEA
ncbi:MAG: oligosaccharide flippase family protein [Vicinamibacterales bacterium]